MNDRENYKAIADEMGLEYARNIPTEKLVEMVEAEKAAREEGAMEAKAASFATPEPEKDTKKTSAQDKVAAVKESFRMRKCIVTPLDERMREYPSEMFSVGNSKTGFITKVVKFNVETIEPVSILGFLESKQALMQVKTTVNGKEIVRKQFGKAFNIQYLEFTDEEIEKFKSK